MFQTSSISKLHSIDEVNFSIISQLQWNWFIFGCLIIWRWLVVSGTNNESGTSSLIRRSRGLESRIRCPHSHPQRDPGNYWPLSCKITLIVIDFKYVGSGSCWSGRSQSGGHLHPNGIIRPVANSAVHPGTWRVGNNRKSRFPSGNAQGLSNSVNPILKVGFPKDRRTTK